MGFFGGGDIAMYTQDKCIQLISHHLPYLIVEKCLPCKNERWTVNIEDNFQ